MDKKFMIISFGAVTQDIMFYTDEAVLIKKPKNHLQQELIAFEYGAKIRSEKVNFTFGGGGGNTAVSFAKLGLPVCLIAKVGEDRIGDDYLKNLRNNKVETTLIQKGKSLGSGFSFIINYGDYNEHVIFSFRGANNYLQINEQKLKAKKAEWYYLASLPKNDLINNLNKIFKIAQKNKIKIAWNPGISELAIGYQGLKNYLNQTEVLIVNYDEAIELAQSANIKTKNKNILLKTLKNFGPKIVTISHGHWGAYLADGKNNYYEKALPMVGVNTTGAGDAFGSSLVGGLILFNYNLEKSLKLAIIRSNYVIRKIGAQTGLLPKKESLKLLKKLWT